MDRTAKVIIVDSRRFARTYIEMCVGTSPRYEVVASIPLAEELPKFVDENPADLITLDIPMERGVDGLTAAAKVKRSHPGIKIIICTSLNQTDWMDKAKSIGIESFWHNEYSKLPLLEAMDRTMDGESVYINDYPEIYLGKLPTSKLTEKQKELLSYLIGGYTNKVIAEKMFLSANTVKSYLDDIMLTSGIHSRTELAVCASKLGL